MRFQFFLKEPNAKKPTSIRLVFQKIKRVMYGTGLSIHPDFWDFGSQRPKRKSEIPKKHFKDNPHLETELKTIHQRCDNIITLSVRWFNHIEIQNTPFDQSDYKKYLSSHFKPRNNDLVIKNQIPFIDEILEEFITGISNGSILTKERGRYALATIKVYKSLRTVFKEFQKWSNSRYKFEDISYEMADKWCQFMYEDRGSSKSTVGKHHKHFKRVMLHKLEEISTRNFDNQRNELPLVLENYVLHSIKTGLKQFIQFKSEKTKIALTLNELSNLYHFNNLAKHEEVARDIFLCCCFTGLRYSDCSKIQSNHIIRENGQDRLRIIVHKGKREITIPLHPNLKSILEKYGFNLPKSSNQKVNEYIKEVCKKAGLTKMTQIKVNKGGVDHISFVPKYKLISTHAGRRTGLTLLHKDNLPLKDIAVISGHKRLSTLENYLKITQEESLERIEKTRYFNTPLLKVVNGES